jgi:isopentenyldiphosphate isomerase
MDREDIREISRLYRELRRGTALSQERMTALVAEWEPKVQPEAKERSEFFGIARPDGTLTGVTGPRWIFHLLGLRHMAVEIAFQTEHGLIVLQRRSLTKEDWPGAPDMAVAGHVPVREGGSAPTFEQGAWKEIEEEIGLREQDAATDLVEKRLLEVGAPYLSFDLDINRDPPFYNAEVRQIFAATLTGKGLSRLRFQDGEVMGMLLVEPDIAWQMLLREDIASGMRYSLPRYLDWLERQKEIGS